MEATEVQHIQVTPGLRGGKPHIAGTRITVSDIVILHLKLGQPVAEIAAEYDLSLADVYAALAYYFDHRAAIDRQMEEDEVYAEAFARSNPSKLQAKLNR
jgi:uncharacterized protein (DUF433 family)